MLDKCIWCLVVVLVLAGIFANMHFQQIDAALRAVAALVLFAMLIALVLLTQHGKHLAKFALEARHELRKVVWPTRQEAGQNTLIVSIIVAVMSCLLWGVDSMLSWLIAWIMG